MPAGPKIAFTGGLDCNDHALIWGALDKVHAKHPDMVLLHGGSPTGAERIAACWADNRKVHADRLQAGLDPARQGRAVQAQRPDSGGAADRRHRLPGLGHPGKPRRQGPEARHPRLAVRHGRRVSAAFRQPLGRRRSECRPFTRAVVVVEGATGRLCHGDPPWSSVSFSALSASASSAGCCSRLRSMRFHSLPASPRASPPFTAVRA